MTEQELEKEIWVAMCQAGENRLSDPKVFFTEKDRAIAAAKVARKYALEIAEKAFSAGEKHQIGKFFKADPKLNPDMDIWLKENGLTE